MYPFGRFYTKIDTSRTIASFFERLAICARSSTFHRLIWKTNRQFTPINQSVLPITLSQLQMDLSIQKWNIYFLLSENLRLHGPFIWVLIMLQKTLVKVGSKPMQWELTVSWKQQLKKTVLTTLTLRTTARENEWFKRWMIRVILLIIYNAVIRTQKCAKYL